MKRSSNLHHHVSPLEIIAISLILLPIALFSQDIDWINYTSNSSFSISAIADDGTHLWVSGSGEGLIRLHKTSGEIIYYNSTNSGLPANYVRSLAVDRQNNLWIGTQHSGLVKFDGTNWSIYNTDNSNLPGDDIYSLLIDRNENIWIGTGQGLIMFDGESWIAYNGLPTGCAAALAIDEKDHIWVGIEPRCNSSSCTGGGLMRFNGVNWTIVYDIAQIWTEMINLDALVIDANGNAWLDTDEGLMKFDGTDWTVYTTDNSELPDNKISALAIDTHGNIWIGTWWNGLAKYDGTNWTVYNANNSELPDDHISALAIDVEGDILIGTQNGRLVEYDGNNWITYETGTSDLPSNNVNALAIDNEDNVWIGTEEGLAKFNRTSWVVYNSNTAELPGNNIGAITVDKGGNIWVGLQQLPHISRPECGLFKFDGTDWTFIHQTHISVHAIAIDEDGNKWIGTENGLVKFDGENWIEYDKSYLPGSMVSSIAIDTQGDIWLGTREPGWSSSIGGGVVKYDGENWTVYDTANSELPDNYVNALMIDQQGNKWIGTKQGMAKFDGENWTVFDTMSSDLPSNYIFCIISDTQDNKWIGTDAGLAKFDGENWVAYTNENSNLISNWISTIAIDKYGNKWIGTQLGGLSVYREGGVILTDMDTKEKYREGLPSEFLLYQNYPNPFNPTTTIRYHLPESGFTTIEVFNIAGQLIETLVREHKNGGFHSVEWNTSNAGSGIYFYRMKIGNFIDVKKCVKMK